MDGIAVRPARREDCQAIRDLIQELANFEEMPDGPKIGAETLEKDGFGEQPIFFSLVAEHYGKLVGYAIFYFTYSTWGGKSMFLEDLYAVPAVRNKGVGSLLFNAVAQRAVDTNCHRLDFMVLKWNPAVNFYKYKGAVDLTEAEKWHHYRLTSEALKKLVENPKNAEDQTKQRN